MRTAPLTASLALLLGVSCIEIPAPPEVCNDGILNGDETSIDCGGECDPCDNQDACMGDQDCPQGQCVDGTCAGSPCTDGVRNGEETDVDCGGDQCASCALGQACGADEDCSDGQCIGSICCIEGEAVCSISCTDGVQNGTESDVDCGGECEQKCQEGQRCTGIADCASMYCPDGTCAAPGCDDGVRNGNESDIDCGGGLCDSCPDEGMCMLNEDCASAQCIDGICTAVGCDDGVRNGTETDIDCGGQCETKCPLNGGCLVNSDCATNGACVPGEQGEMGRCAAPDCFDGIENQNETDVDCGGLCDQRCLVGNGCEGDSDCTSELRCESEQCVAQHCQDNEVNEDETDIDCGGQSCLGCLKQRLCQSAGDCRGDLMCLPLGAIDAVCAPATCADLEVGGGETDFDCGGPDCPKCTTGQTCRRPADCLSNLCLSDDDEPLPPDNTERSGSCTDACEDGERNGDESSVDCGGQTCETRCQVGDTCRDDSDCEANLICALEGNPEGVCVPG